MASNCILQQRKRTIQLKKEQGAHRGTSRAAVGIAGPVLVNAALASSSRIGVCSSHQSCRKPMQLGNSDSTERFTAYWGTATKRKKGTKQEPAATLSASPALHARVPAVDRAQPQGTTTKPQTWNPPDLPLNTQCETAAQTTPTPTQLHTSAPTQSPLLFQAHSHREFGIWAVFSHKCHLMPRAQHNSRAMHKRELSSDKQHCTAFLTCLLHYPKVQTAKGKYPGTVWVQSKNMHYREVKYCQS